MNTIKNITAAGVLAALLFPVSVMAQRVETYTDTNGDRYAAINAAELPRNVVDRSGDTSYYVDASLYKYTVSGEASDPVVDESGNPVTVKRPKRHVYFGCTVSKRFLVSPTDVYNDGATAAGPIGDTGTQNSVTMDWATANGWLATANTTKPGTENSATAMGCPQYRGKSGKDAPGTWRTPTQREGALLLIFREQIEDTAPETGFEPFYVSYYWLGTEENSFGTNAWTLRFTVPYQSSISNSGMNKKRAYRLRCVRDIPSDANR